MEINDTPTPDAPKPDVPAKADAAPVEPQAQGNAEADALRNEVVALKAALEAANKTAVDQSTALQGQLSALQAEAVAERRAAALDRLGLPAAYHDVAPKGDPRDPRVAAELEAWATAHPLLFQSRAPKGPQVDLESLSKKLPSGGKGLTNMANMQANWETMRGGK